MSASSTKKHGDLVGRDDTGDKSKKLVSISQALSWFVVVNILVLGILITGLMTLRIDKAVRQSQQKHVSSQMQVLKEQFTGYLRDRQQMLSDHASFPILVQGLMQPEANQGVVKDFMMDLNFLGQAYQEVLLDFRGQPLVKTREYPMFDYKYETWLHGLMKGKINQYIGVSSINGEYYWRIAQPVYFNGLPEGVLVIEIPLVELAEQLNLSHNLRGIALEIFWQGKVVQTIGTIKSNYSVELHEPLTGSTLRFYIDNRAALAARNQLITETVLLILAVAFIMVKLSISLGKHQFVYPIKGLQQFSRTLAAGSSDCHIPDGQRVREFEQLAQDFNHMANRVRKREDALRRNRDELEKVNRELKNSQNQLAQSEKMASLGILAAGVAHEINNPISFIKSNSTTLMEYMEELLPLLREYLTLARTSSDVNSALFEKITQHIDENDLLFMLDDIEPMLSDTIDGTNRVLDIVAGLKNFVRADTAEMNIFDINDCIDSTLKVVWNELKYKCDVKKMLGQVPQISGNQGEINQVVMNLLVNAAHAITDKGEIRIHTGYKSNRVFMEISDTGKGIPEEDMDKLFTPFFTTKPVGAGTGLGLSISHGIIEKHGGEIKVISKVGKGTRFTVWLPASSNKVDILKTDKQLAS